MIHRILGWSIFVIQGIFNLCPRLKKTCTGILAVAWLAFCYLGGIGKLWQLGKCEEDGQWTDFWHHYHNFRAFTYGGWVDHFFELKCLVSLPVQPLGCGVACRVKLIVLQFCCQRRASEQLKRPSCFKWRYHGTSCSEIRDVFAYIGSTFMHDPAVNETHFAAHFLGNPAGSWRFAINYNWMQLVVLKITGTIFSKMVRNSRLQPLSLPEQSMGQVGFAWHGS